MREDLATIPRLADIQYQAPYTEEWLQEQRSVGDPLADDVIARLSENGELGSPHDLLRMVRERAASEGGVFKAFLDACEAVPPWVDFERMRQGQRLIASAVPFMGLSLLTGSLVGGYVFVKAAKVTALTGRLAMPGDISRRLVETSALVLLMSRPDEIRPGGRAHETLMRVRLLHGALRRWMHRSGRWRAAWDEPVNQEDLAITLSEFSYLNIRSLLRMGLRLSDEQIASHYHLWRYAGHVLGIAPPLLPDSFEGEVRQFLPMLKHQARPEEGAPEARNILDEVADKAEWLPEDVRRNFLHQVTAYLVGEELVRGLRVDVDARFWGIPLLRALGLAWSAMHHVAPLGERVLHALGQRAIERHLALARRGPLHYGVKTHDRDSVRAALRQRRPATATG